jgi:NADH-quinone oxidoreductase subunit M
MYFLIGIWGGPQREYAAIKFFLYTLVGSVLMLVAIIWMYLSVTPHTFDMTVLAEKSPWSPAAGRFLWVLFFIGFAIKIPMFPFHTWLPIAHVEAPTAISVILAGVLLKMGTYGILRVNYPILPEATLWAAPFMAWFGLINIVYGALCAMAQSDMKRLVAYSSISHMGYCLLGMASMTPEGLNGAYLQMVSHGLITAMLFLLVGVIYDRAHTREIEKFGGLANVMPVYTGFVTVAFFASLGLPGLSGFVAEALTLIGAWSAPLTRNLVWGALVGIVITAGYHLWLIQRAFLGPVNERWKDLPEIDGREMATLIPLVILVIYIGVYPNPTIRLFDATLTDLLRFVVR